MTITEYKKKNGEVVYKTQVYLGIDSITGKKAMTTITAPTKKLVKAKVTQAKADFVSNGYTLKQIRRVPRLKNSLPYGGKVMKVPSKSAPR